MMMLAALLALTAHASDLDRRHELSLRLGGYGSGQELTINGTDEVADGGGFGGFRYVYNLDEMVGIGLDLSGLDAGRHESRTLISRMVTESRLSTSEILATVRVRLRKERFRPYVLAGLGMQTTSFELHARPQPGFLWSDTSTGETRTFFDAKKSGAAFALETGFDYHFTRNFSGGAFFGLHLQGKHTYAPTRDGANFGLTGISAAFGGAGLGASLTGRF